MTSDRAEQVQVVFAEDHELFRAGMVRAITGHPRLELVAETSNGIDALAAIERLDPTVALVDVRMPGIDGLELCRTVMQRRPPLRTKVVLVTAFPDELSAAEASAAGAVRLLGKTGSRQQLCAELLAAVEDAAPNENFREEVSRASKNA